MNFLSDSIIFSTINLNNIYILSNAVNFVRILSFVIILYFLIVKFRQVKIIPSTAKLLLWALILIVYKLILDSTLHFNHNTEALTTFLKGSFVVLLLPVFEEMNKERNLIKTIIICSIPAIILGVLQINNPNINLDNLLPANKIIYTPKITDSYLHAESRIVGTYDVAIGFALFLGIICIILWSKFIMTKRSGRILFGIAMFFGIHFLIIFTQTRSAIYGVIPSILLAYVVSGEKLVKKMVIASMISILLLFVFGYLYCFVLDYSKRSTLEVDANTYYKITANVYGTYGALSKNPLFGVSKSALRRDSPEQFRIDYKRDMELIKEGERNLGNLFEFKNKYKLTQTYHNLYAFYLRHYGLVGFFLFVMMLIAIYKKIKLKKDKTDRYMLLGIFCFTLQYALLHNTKILSLPIFWILLSIGKEAESSSVMCEG